MMKTTIFTRYTANIVYRIVPPIAFGLGFRPAHKTEASQKSVPSKFGFSVRHVVTSLPDDINKKRRDDQDNCPVCKKYSQGPCGKLFVKWLSCTDEFPGQEADRKTECHIIKCRSLAEPLAKCLEKEAEYYESLDIHAKDDQIIEEDLREPWEKVIQELEDSWTAVAFPSQRPFLEIRPQSRTGMAGFHYTLANKNSKSKKVIVLAYVRDTHTGELLAAGSMEDLWEYDGKGILRLSFEPECRCVTAYALYQGEDDSDNSDFLYKYTINISGTKTQ